MFDPNPRARPRANASLLSAPATWLRAFLIVPTFVVRAAVDIVNARSSAAKKYWSHHPASVSRVASWLLGQPPLDYERRVHRLFREEEHRRARHRGGRRELQVVALEDEVHVRPELNALAGRERQQPVIVEHGVERLDPLGVDVAVADDPAVLIEGLLHHLPRRVREHAVEPLAGVHVHVPEQLLAVDSLRVHHVAPHRPPELLVRALQDVPERRLTRPRRPDDDDPDALRARDVQLKHLLHLRRDVFVVLFREHFFDRRLELGVAHVAHSHAGVHVVQEVGETRSVRERQLRQRRDARRANHELRLSGDVHGVALRARVSQKLPRDPEHCLQRAQPPVVVLLRREQLFAQGKQAHEFPAQRARRDEALREQNHLCDELEVGHGHRDRAEQLLQVVRELTAPAVPFPRGVEGDENAGVVVHVNLSRHERHGRRARLQRRLDGLDLRRHRAQDLFLETVELVETAPTPRISADR
jgi:hypothetical protein